MSALSPPVVRDPISTSLHAQPDADSPAAFDARWSVWIERGRVADRATQRNMRFVLVGAAVVAILAALVFGFTSGAR